MPFTEYQIQRIKPGSMQRVITETGVSPDLRGLQLRVSTAGSKTWILRYKIDGKVRILSLGNYPTVTLADAHRLVQEHRASIRDGKDPAVAKQAKVRANQAAPTVQMLFEDFRDHHLRRNRKRPEDAEQPLLLHIVGRPATETQKAVPGWGETKAADITRRQIIERIREIEESGSPRMAEVVKALLTQMFRYGVDVGMLDTSPAVALPMIGNRGNVRERILSDDEIKTFWAKLSDAALAEQTRNAYRLLLILGQRRGEVAMAEWSEFDLDGGIWTIPASRSKNGKAHLVPLPQMALDVLDAMQNDKAWLLPSPRGNGPIDPHALSRGIRNNEEHFGIDPAFTCHDLRRTVASQMAALGTARLVVGKVLNHTDQSITAVYDQHDYFEEKHTALDTWAKHLQAIIKGKTAKVVPISKSTTGKRKAAR
jgi:integrase